MAAVSFFDLAHGLATASHAPRKLGRSITEVMEKSKGLLDNDSEMESGEFGSLHQYSRNSNSLSGSFTTPKNATNPRSSSKKTQDGRRTEEPAPAKVVLAPASWRGPMLPSLRTKEDVLKHMESQGHSFLVNFIVDPSVWSQLVARGEEGAKKHSNQNSSCFMPNGSSFVSQWRSSIAHASSGGGGGLESAAESSNSKHLQFSLRVHSTSSVTALVGRSLRHWLTLRESIGDPLVLSAASMYYSEQVQQSPVSPLRSRSRSRSNTSPIEGSAANDDDGENEDEDEEALPDWLVDLFQDAMLGLCDLSGRILVPLKRLVRNKKRWVPAVPAVDGATDQFSPAEAAANERINDIAVSNNLAFSQKSILSLLTNKVYPKTAMGNAEASDSFVEEGGWSSQCVAPPYYFTLYIPQPTIKLRTVLKQELEERMAIDAEANTMFFSQFARPYWTVLLQMDRQRRNQWAQEQALQRHALHRLFFYATHDAQLATMRAEEHAFRISIAKETIKDWHVNLHLENERLQYAIGCFQSRQTVVADAEAREREAITDIFLLGRGEQSQKEVLMDTLADFTQVGEQLVEEGWKERLSLLHQSMKLIMVMGNGYD